jgi:rare lipoprotein A
MNRMVSPKGWLAVCGACTFAGMFLATAADAAQVPALGAGSKKTEIGLASYYEDKDFGGLPMAWGEPFREALMIAAHPTHPAGTLVRVTNLENGRSVLVRIADRGPAAKHQNQGVIIDLSRGAAERLKFVKQGRALVQTEVVIWGSEAMQTPSGAGQTSGR